MRDTATLFRLPNERFLSLRFLTAQVLKADIQDETHDSIEDARAALLLERKYTQLEASGKIHKWGYCTLGITWTASPFTLRPDT